ncbi:hypothetical protein [Paenibacillus pini]|uniref:hypothetical protein n=1 Tax=Paenibacillus pini TaxID=669461 RepID=UPI00056C12BE|nr:hypothetical protein [Paenibacillus pini]
MNKQPERLISPEKVIADMERRMIELIEFSPSSDYDVAPVINALENFIERLKSDKYLPDPIPLPTIKQEEKPKQSCPACGNTGIHYCRGRKIRRLERRNAIQ